MWDDEKDEVTVFAVNRSLTDDIVMECDLRSFSSYELLEHIVLENSDMKAVNTSSAQNVCPVSVSDRTVKDGGIFKSKLSKTSWNVIRFKNRA